MKCALELMATAAVKAEENAIAEAIRRQQEADAKRKRTIKICEQFGAELEALANGGKHPKTSFHCDRWGCPLSATRKDYADHRLSYRVSGESIDLQLLKSWFAQYCFEVTLSEFGYYRYNWGWCGGYTIEIAPKPECLS